jgi:hypothetical protein
LGELPDSLGQRRTFFWPNCVPLIGHIQSTAISENHHMGFGFFVPYMVIFQMVILIYYFVTYIWWFSSVH